jgi:hypothetical protein
LSLAIGVGHIASLAMAPSDLPDWLALLNTGDGFESHDALGVGNIATAVARPSPLVLIAHLRL